MTPSVVVLTLTVDELEALVARAVERALSTSGQCSTSPSLITKQALATALSCSVATVDRMVRDGAPHVLVGKTRRFDINAVRAWLSTRERHTQPAASGVRLLSRKAVS